VGLSFCWGTCGIEEMGRKLSTQVLMGLQAIGADSWRFGCPGQTENHMAHGRPCPRARQTRAPPSI